MKHYDINEWTDFVRQVGDTSRREDMSQHLATGCNKCSGIVSFLEKLVTVTRSDTTKVPEQLVRNVQVMFAMSKPEKVSLASTVAKLVFDSFSEPVPVGVRGQHRVTRQAMYEAGDYCVDLRMEHERGGAMITLVGQVASRKNPAQGIAGTPVMLMAGQDVVAKASCNRFGEFQMEYQAQQPVRLHVPVADENRWIEVRLHELSPDNSGD